MEKSILIRSCWSNELDSDLKKDFVYLVNSVFDGFLTDECFKTKFMDNIYGPSLLTVGYVDGNPAGADAMWRNDVFGTEAYQSVDTCVLEKYRGMGLFKKITYYEMDLLGENAWVYGYPNVNSYPGYVKMGWNVERLYKTLYLFNKADAKTVAIIDRNYASWWLKAQDGITYVFRKNCYFLIRKNKTKPVATIIGRVEDNTAKLFPKTNGVLLLKYFNKKHAFYNKKKSIPLIFNKMENNIPYWKIDAV